MEYSKVRQLLKEGFDKFVKPENLKVSRISAATMTGLTALENLRKGEAFDDYDQALYMRFAYTFLMAQVFMGVYREIKKILPEGVLKRPLTVGLSSLSTTTMTYVVQKLADDPQALGSTGWTAVLSIAGFTFMEIREVLEK